MQALHEVPYSTMYGSIADILSNACVFSSLFFLVLYLVLASYLSVYSHPVFICKHPFYLLQRICPVLVTILFLTPSITNGMFIYSLSSLN